jgi:hypothetical protein
MVVVISRWWLWSVVMVGMVVMVVDGTPFFHHIYVTSKHTYHPTYYLHLSLPSDYCLFPSDYCVLIITPMQRLLALLPTPHLDFCWWR